MSLNKKIRIISRLDINNDFVIKGLYYEGLRKVGDPEKLAQKYYEDGSDEIIFLDSVASLYDRNSLIEIIKKVSKNVFIPITVGGGIRSLKDIRNILRSGADKIAINSHFHKNKSFVKNAVHAFGSSTIVGSITAMKTNENWNAYIDNGKHKIKEKLLDILKRFEDSGVGEIIINSKDKDGMMQGFDIDLIKLVSNTVKVPIIASSGAGNSSQIINLVKETNCDAVSLASILHYNIDTIKNIKKSLKENKIFVRS